MERRSATPDALQKGNSHHTGFPLAASTTPTLALAIPQPPTSGTSGTAAAPSTFTYVPPPLSPRMSSSLRGSLHPLPPAAVVPPPAEAVALPPQVPDTTLKAEIDSLLAKYEGILPPPPAEQSPRANQSLTAVIRSIEATHGLGQNSKPPAAQTPEETKPKVLFFFFFLVFY